MRGEKQHLLQSLSEAQGSPPHARGKATAFSAFQAHRRITPACAGKSDLLGESQGGRKDHPRVCGEK